MGSNQNDGDIRLKNYFLVGQNVIIWYFQHEKSGSNKFLKELVNLMDKNFCCRETKLQSNL